MALIPAIYEPDLDDAFLVLLTVTVPDLSDTAYIVNNLEDVVSRGNTYLAYPFSITLPSELEDEQPRVEIVIDNVDRRITEFIRAQLEPPLFKIEVVLASSPDTVERTVDYLTLSDVEYDAATVKATLTPADLLSLPAIDHYYDATQFPDLLY